MNNLDLKKFNSTSPKIKYSEAKKAIQMSIDTPNEIYQSFDFFQELLNSNNNILKWTGIKVIGNLSAVDKENKIDKVLPILIKLASDPRMITAANTIESLGTIARYKPQFLKKIIHTLLNIETVDFYINGILSPECQNIAIGHVLKTFQKLGNEVLKARNIQKFITKQLQNSRPAVAKLANKLIIQIT